MALQLVTAPTEEPVGLAEMKAHLRVIDTSEDLHIAMLIGAAREDAEMITRRALCTQTWKLVGDRFPSPMAGRLTEYWFGQNWGLAGMGGVSAFLPTDRTGYAIALPFGSLQSVGSIKYLDQGGVLQTLAPAAYVVDSVSEPARIVCASGYAWPTTKAQVNAVEITFTAGYGAAAAVPMGVKNWIKLRVATLYENREEVAMLAKGKIQELPYVDTLLNPYRLFTL